MVKKLKENMNIIVMEGASDIELKMFAKELKRELKNASNNSGLITNAKGMKLYKLIKGELFEVVPSLKKVVTHFTKKLRDELGGNKHGRNKK